MKKNTTMTRQWWLLVIASTLLFWIVVPVSLYHHHQQSQDSLFWGILHSTSTTTTTSGMMRNAMMEWKYSPSSQLQQQRQQRQQEEHYGRSLAVQATIIRDQEPIVHDMAAATTTTTTPQDKEPGHAESIVVRHDNEAVGPTNAWSRHHHHHQSPDQRHLGQQPDQLHPPPRMVVAGLVLDTSQIRPSLWKVLQDLSCHYGASIHIVAKFVSDPNESDDNNQEVATNHTSSGPTRPQWCAPIYMERQDDLLLLMQQQRQQRTSDRTSTPYVPPPRIAKHRLQRLAQIRDLQRERIRTLFFSSAESNNKNKNDNDIVVLLDLDMWNVPSAEQIVHRAQSMHTFDVICGAGHWVDHPLESALLQWKHLVNQKELLQQRRLRRRLGPDQQPQLQPSSSYLDHVPHQPQDLKFYYDNFAFVAWPDTFGFIHRQRLIPSYYAQENVGIVPETLGTAQKQKQHHIFTQYELYMHLQHLALEYSRNHHPHANANADSTTDSSRDDNNDNALAPVRSCFGGLALYRATTWLTPQCQYDLLGMVQQTQQRQEQQQEESEEDSSTLLSLSPPNMYLLRNGRRLLPDPNLDTNILRYASKKEGLPCEHVVFHDCLHRVVFSNSTTSSSDGSRLDLKQQPSPPPQPRVAVDPQLVTYWKRNKEEDDKEAEAEAEEREKASKIAELKKTKHHHQQTKKRTNKVIRRRFRDTTNA
ncbi:hypothetical protein ACA910_000657 [Epithemia clementina (nom. ined.)]